MPFYTVPFIVTWIYIKDTNGISDDYNASSKGKISLIKLCDWFVLPVSQWSELLAGIHQQVSFQKHMVEFDEFMRLLN